MANVTSVTTLNMTGQNTTEASNVTQPVVVRTEPTPAESLNNFWQAFMLYMTQLGLEKWMIYTIIAFVGLIIICSFSCIAYYCCSSKSKSKTYKKGKDSKHDKLQQARRRKKSLLQQQQQQLEQQQQQQQQQLQQVDQTPVQTLASATAGQQTQYQPVAGSGVVIGTPAPPMTPVAAGAQSAPTPGAVIVNVGSQSPQTPGPTMTNTGPQMPQPPGVVASVSPKGPMEGPLMMRTDEGTQTKTGLEEEKSSCWKRVCCSESRDQPQKTQLAFPRTYSQTFQQQYSQTFQNPQQPVVPPTPSAPPPAPKEERKGVKEQAEATEEYSGSDVESEVDDFDSMSESHSRRDRDDEDETNVSASYDEGSGLTSQSVHSSRSYTESII